MFKGKKSIFGNTGFYYIKLLNKTESGQNTQKNLIFSFLNKNTSWDFFMACHILWGRPFRPKNPLQTLARIHNQTLALVFFRHSDLSSTPFPMFRP